MVADFDAAAPEPLLDPPELGAGSLEIILPLPLERRMRLGNEGRKTQGNVAPPGIVPVGIVVGSVRLHSALPEFFTTCEVKGTTCPRYGLLLSARISKAVTLSFWKLNRSTLDADVGVTVNL